MIQGHDEKLYYRIWRDDRVEASGELPDEGTGVTVFPDTRFAARMSVVDFTAAAEPGYEVVPLGFDRDRHTGQPRVKVRLTVDGETRDIWLSDEFAEDGDERFASMRGKDRFVGLRMGYRWMDLGFQVELLEFECRFDPGTSQPSHYGSRVEFLTKDKEPRVLGDTVFLSPNRPAEMTDPTSGRVFRFFQNAPRRPYVFRPGQPEFERHVGGRKKTDRLYRSTFMVAHDPGRSLKYAGCFMIIGGIVVMYYMKAYLFRRRNATKPENT